VITEFFKRALRGGMGHREDPAQLFAAGNALFESARYVEAAQVYEQLVRADPGHRGGYHNWAAAVCQLGRYREAESLLRRAIAADPADAESHGDLGTVLRWLGEFAESERCLRFALKLNPTLATARGSLGLTLLHFGRLRQANAAFDKVLKAKPRHAGALVGRARAAMLEGRFDAAAAACERALAVDPKSSGAVALQAALRKMTRADEAWVRNAESIADLGLARLEEAELRFAIGKYYDDVGDFAKAFASFARANELQKCVAQPYRRAEREREVDGIVAVCSQAAIAAAAAGSSASTQPVFVLGMMRSGTSLVEQIIASHPAAGGAGELGYWPERFGGNGPALRAAMLSTATREQLAAGFLEALNLGRHPSDRIVDKTPANADFVGFLHGALPQAKIIHLERNPIDTCLSIFFQHFSASLGFATDLEDLAHYYLQHRRLLAHWRAVLPPGVMLDVPYESLVNDPEAWTRKILEFIGLGWDPRCLDFHRNPRPVVTASAWQVRQPIYRGAVGRWQNYRPYIKPLLKLGN
jgi:tetratricopeptide (TPR) repeat protein